METDYTLPSTQKCCAWCGDLTKHPSGLPRVLAEAATYGKYSKSKAHSGVSKVKPIAPAKAAPMSKAAPVSKDAPATPASASGSQQHPKVPVVDPKASAHDAMLEVNKAKEVLAEKEKRHS